MVSYKIGYIECFFKFEDFISLECDFKKYYKCDFIDFSSLIKFIDENIKQITKIVFDNKQYVLENGLLHNLYGPSITVYPTPGGHNKNTIKRYFINGNIIESGGDIDILSDKIFKNGNIYYKDNKNKKVYIILDDLIKQDIRKQKLKRILWD